MTELHYPFRGHTLQKITKSVTGSLPSIVSKNVGVGSDEVPLNSFLGALAYRDKVGFAELVNRPDSLEGYNIGDAYTKDETDSRLGEKVSEVSGKGLSSNDFTDSLKGKLATLPNGWEFGAMAFRDRLSYGELLGVPSTFAPQDHSHTFASLTGKPNSIDGYGILDGVKTTDSRLSDKREPLAHSHTIADIGSLSATLNSKVDKDGTKVLSSNDFTDSLKSKVSESYAPWAFGAMAFRDRLAFKELLSTPSTLNGYGITDGVNVSDIGTTVPNLVNGLIPSSQLPSYIDDVLEFSSLSALQSATLANGAQAVGKIYITIDTGRIYRWSGSSYVDISAKVDSVSGRTGAITLSKSDVGLGNVDNTSDLAKPISTLTQTALNSKVDAISGKGLSSNDFTSLYKDKIDGNYPAWAFGALAFRDKLDKSELGLAFGTTSGTMADGAHNHSGTYAPYIHNHADYALKAGDSFTGSMTISPATGNSSLTILRKDNTSDVGLYLGSQTGYKWLNYIPANSSELAWYYNGAAMSLSIDGVLTSSGFKVGSNSVILANDGRLADSRKCNNSFDNTTTARSNLGLTSVAIASFGTTAGSVAYGDHNHSGVYAPATHSHAFSTLTSTPTTLSGYGITDSLIYKTGDTFTGLVGISPATGNSYLVNTRSSISTGEVGVELRTTGSASWYLYSPTSGTKFSLNNNGDKLSLDTSGNLVVTGTITSGTKLAILEGDSRLTDSRAPTAHSHLYAGSSIAGGNATTANKVANSLFPGNGILITNSTTRSFDGSSQETLSIETATVPYTDNWGTNDCVVARTASGTWFAATMGNKLQLNYNTKAINLANPCPSITMSDGSYIFNENDTGYRGISGGTGYTTTGSVIGLYGASNTMYPGYMQLLGSSSASSLLQITGFKRVGVGTTNPAEMLDVNGYAKATGFKTTSGTSAMFLKADGTTDSTGYTTNTGTVTSVGGTGTVSGLSLSGTVIGSGNLTLSGTLSVTASNFASQTAKYALIAPAGAAGTPTFRALTTSDISDIGTWAGSSNITSIGACTATSIKVTGGTSSGFLKANGTTDTTAYTANTGTVTSVATSATAVRGLYLSGGPITGSGTISIAGDIVVNYGTTVPTTGSTGNIYLLTGASPKIYFCTAANTWRYAALV